jgi:hypothetical protein
VQEEVESGSRSDTAKLQKGLGLAKALFAFCGEAAANIRALAFTNNFEPIVHRADRGQRRATFFESPGPLGQVHSDANELGAVRCELR